MAKWISSLFKDIQGQVAKQNVFSRWKGRHYFRAYVIPANPKTNKQLAQRALVSAAVAAWQSDKKGNSDAEGSWDKRGEYRKLPGFQIFTAYAAGSEVETSAGASGEVDVTGSTNMILGDAAILPYHAETDAWEDGMLWEVDAKDSFSHTFSGLVSADHYQFYLVSNFVYGDLSSPEWGKAWITSLYKDESAGTAPSNTITVP